jgi:hypothetical protein
MYLSIPIAEIVPLTEIIQNYSYTDDINNLPIPPPVATSIHVAEEVQSVYSVDLPHSPDFSFSLNERMLKSAYEVIEECDAWSLLQNFSGNSFTWSTDPNIINLMGKINTAYDDLHSGGSLGYVMRELEYIAKYGFSEYKHNYMLSNRL